MLQDFVPNHYGSLKNVGVFYSHMLQIFVCKRGNVEDFCLQTLERFMFANVTDSVRKCYRFLCPRVTDFCFENVRVFCLQT